ncbi:ADP-ribose diphosphatase [Shewanella intestini]|uniref:ADP-ribose pyrophosphatase n=1 Tax=Shewanella intestini TaxID=2017544 RepID=A0ABS5I0W7_9GAMM|nr:MULTISPECIES: ADP-ribose diphosphatase [Shewanella]MBR9727666.1 ADP-ribose diphosphatase [Shewanella intestini]MRG35184.1 ADP-ribose diphosphatase [Shewanella sp. XMDDZSB0408]
MPKPPLLKTFNANDDVDMLSIKPLYQGFFTLAQYTFRHKLFAGGWSQPVTREVFERGHAVVVLPYDPKTDSIVLIEQIRIPSITTTKQVWLLELVAGMIEENESHLEVAKRELAEETGLVGESWQYINSFLASPGGTTERFYLYLAHVDSSKAQGIHGLVSESEDIKVHVVSRARAYEMTQTGEIDNVSTVLGIQWLMLNLQRM